MRWYMGDGSMARCVAEIDEDDLTGLKTVGDCVRYLYNKMS